jgi:hypothetical protein
MVNSSKVRDESIDSQDIDFRVPVRYSSSVRVFPMANDLDFPRIQRTVAHRRFCVPVK